jgi:hypothetical protein
MINPMSPRLPSYTVTASDGRRYRLTPNAVRVFQTAPGQPKQDCFTFSYRRIDENGQPIKRIRISKKNRLRLKRAVALAA